MGTFTCTQECDRLCSEPRTSSLVGRYMYYPGLTPDERRLVSEHPKDAIKVFIQKTRAESSVDRNFSEQGRDDESDAFRHFIWAGLLTNDLGLERAKEFLDAHEANPLQLPEEEAMDHFNNDRGQNAAQALAKKQQWSLQNLEKLSLAELRSRKLKVIKPGQKISEVPK